MNVHTLDLEFFRGETIAAYLVESGGELALVETGPESTWKHLVAALARFGAKPSDVKNVVVTHIHLDHAGAAWRLAKEGATVWMHPRGAPHMLDPSKLLASARRIYKDEMDALWGTLEPIPPDRLRVTEDGGSIRVGKADLRVLETPGHATHHNAYFLEGNVFTGDVGGVAIAHGPNLPPTPPPDIDLPTWTVSIARIKAAKPDGFFPTHFGLHGSPAERFDEMLDELHEWAAFVRARLDEGLDEPAIVPLFEAWLTERLLARGVSPDLLEAYRTALPFAMNVTGLVRYWKNRGKAA